MKLYVRSNDNNMTRDTYRLDEIKYRIDTAVQTTMFDNPSADAQDLCIDIQTRLYEQFDIDSF